ncbi:DUF1573 domain-containing protein [Blastopirellula marina]|uniref:DUF1573 domain-containing protein n=1 Tax=Blastopirellula marina TaxID=124 RepID=A0A2S8GEH1_9BACT|nr:DUF1573 domain-containing protein [Blastopirellula marina]PQO42856.1 hypothetical protein C5Y98_01510 [Blastopirellula marina]PTL46622.1 DUF1573 domain-containing protein [Blastopirellula marina]
MKPIALLLVCLLVGSAAGYAIAVRDLNTPNDFGGLTDPERMWNEATVKESSPQAIVVDGPVFAFGRMELNSVGRHTFVVKNDGKEELELTMEGTTCKCTMADLKEGDVLRVAPGETTEIKLEWRPKAYQEDFAQTATIATNDPRKPTLELRITGSVVQAVVLEPSEIRLTNMAAGETRKAATKVLSFKDPDFKINDLKVTGDGSELFSVSSRPLEPEELKETSGALAGYLVQLEVKPGLPLGTNRNNIEVATNSEFAPELEISVTSFVVGDISVMAFKKYDKDKGVLYLGKLKRDQGESTKLFLLVKGAHRNDVSIKAKQTSPDYLKMEIGEPESINDGNVRKFPITLEVPEGSPAGNFLGPDREKLGKLVLAVDGHPEIKEVDIFVYFSVE